MVSPLTSWAARVKPSSPFTTSSGDVPSTLAKAWLRPSYKSVHGITIAGCFKQCYESIRMRRMIHDIYTSLPHIMFTVPQMLIRKRSTIKESSVPLKLIVCVHNTPENSSHEAKSQTTQRLRLRSRQPMPQEERHGLQEKQPESQRTTVTELPWIFGKHHA